MSVVITNLGSNIQFSYTGGSSYTFNKATMRLKQDQRGITVTNSDSFNQGKDNKVLELKYSEVTSPVYASDDALYAGLQDLIGDSSYDEGTGSTLVSVLNPGYAHWTSVEHLIDESNLGIDATYDGGGAQDTVMTDTGEAYTSASVAEGYTIYNVTQATSAIITADTLSGLAGDGGAGNPTADDITHAALGANWVDTNVVSIPECKRFVIPAEGYNLLSIDVLLDSQDANNSCYCKIYATNDSNADDTDDIYWKDISSDVFGAAQLSADGIGDAARAVTQGIYFIDTPTTVLKYMIKVICECSNGTQNSEIDVLVKKSS